ncbi:hypothetical protein [Sebaldella sp. S0638]|uniref:hypothetical protein n=1 Tax=Sebaldella sp. S0638 TaxID=2957809 RepID=UPI0020A05B34|nr:hypothetical protein [Sebaldella sp. S0638]MCP1226681.1 hypothetical protein [Sebaldella sp. S0638]
MKKVLFVFLAVINLACAGKFPVKLGEYQYGLSYIEISDIAGQMTVRGQIEVIPTDSCMKGCVDIDSKSVSNPEKGVLSGKLMNNDKFKLEFIGEDQIKVYIDTRKPFVLEPADF